MGPASRRLGDVCRRAVVPVCRRAARHTPRHTQPPGRLPTTGLPKAVTAPTPPPPELDPAAKLAVAALAGGLLGWAACARLTEPPSPFCVPPDRPAPARTVAHGGPDLEVVDGTAVWRPVWRTAPIVGALTALD